MIWMVLCSFLPCSPQLQLYLYVNAGRWTIAMASTPIQGDSKKIKEKLLTKMKWYISFVIQFSWSNHRHHPYHMIIIIIHRWRCISDCGCSIYLSAFIAILHALFACVCINDDDDDDEYFGDEWSECRDEWNGNGKLCIWYFRGQLQSDQFEIKLRLVKPHARVIRAMKNGELDGKLWNENYN